LCGFCSKCDGQIGGFLRPALWQRPKCRNVLCADYTSDAKYASGGLPAVEGKEPSEPRQTRDVALLLAALLISALRMAVQAAGVRLLFAGPPSGFTGSSFLLRQFFLGELAPFLVSPVVLFLVFYRLGKGVSLTERYRRVAGLAFAGGALGSGATFLLFPLALGGTWGYAFPDLLSALGTVAGVTYAFVSFGLGTLFPGFVAIAVANFRMRGKKAAA